MDGNYRPLLEKNTDWWYPRENYNMIAEAWRTEGYLLKKLDLNKEKVILYRDESGVSKLMIPDVLTSGKIPDNAVYELEHGVYHQKVRIKQALIKSLQWKEKVSVKASIEKDGDSVAAEYPSFFLL